MLPKPLFYPCDHIKATRKKGGKQIESGRMREQERGKSKPCELLNVHRMPLTSQALKNSHCDALPTEEQQKQLLPSYKGIVESELLMSL